jgi:PAS domain S-box-containing protein
MNISAPTAMPQWPINLAKLASSLAIIIGTATLISWVFYFWIPQDYQAILATIKPNTAICFVLCGVSLWLQSERNEQLTHVYYLSQVSSAAVFLISFLTLFEYFFGINLGIDQGIFKEPLMNAPSPLHLPPGRMSPFAATNFALLGFSLFFLDNKTIGYQIHQFFMALVTFLSSLQLLLQLYGSNIATVLDATARFNEIRIPIILTFILLGVGVLLCRPEKGITSIFISKYLGGTLARRLTPAAIIIPILVGYLGLAGKWTGLYEIELGIAILVESTIVSFVVLILVDAFLVNQVDVERLKVEHALKLNEAQLQAILDHTSAMIYIHDLEGKFLLVNKQFEKLFYQKADDVVGKRSHDIFSPNLADNFIENAFKVIQTRLPIAVEEIIPDQDGDHIYISNKFPLFDDQGNLYAVGSISTDITQIKNISDTLRENEERLNLALKSAEAGTWSWDILKDKFIWDDYTHHLFGLKPKTFPGYYEATLSLIHPDDRKLVAETVEQTLNEGTEFNSEFRIIRPNHTIRYLGFRGKVYRDDIDQPIRMTGVCWDITDQKQAGEELRHQKELAEDLAEKAKEASYAKSAFLAAMSHEIRTPLNGVIGMTGLLGDTHLSTDQREYIETIRVSGEALLSVINDILDFSKIESGHMELEEINFDLYALVDDTVEIVAAQIQKKGVAIAAYIEPDVPAWLTGDSSRIRQILNNLLSNSGKFTEKGEIGVKVKLGKKEGKRVTLLFEVTDTGIGIAPEVRAQLFQPFSQGDSSTSRKYGGTGLGLAISKRLVEILGGEIDLDSSAGRGSRFWFTVPLYECEIPSTEVELTSVPPELKGVRILVVDDNTINREVMKRQTESWDIRCDTAINAAEALSMLKKGVAENDPYSLALIDYIMPGMNGLELIQIVRQLPEVAATPIILLSSLGATFSIDELKQLNIATSLPKPVRQAKLCENIVNVLKNRKPDEMLLAPSAETNVQPKRKARILLAEDNPINQQVALRILAKLGYRADVAANGLEVLQALNKIPYDLILMDCQMPEMDGYLTTENIRHLEQKKGGHTLIIAMTAHALKGDREKCLSAGMDDYIAKPIDINMLGLTLDSWLRNTEPPPRPTRTEASAAASETEKTAGASVIDMERLHTIFGDDSTAIHEFMKNFIISTISVLKELKIALKAKDAHLAKELFHRLKGSSGNSGITSMYEICKDSEAKVLNGDWTSANNAYKEVKVVLKRLQEEVKINIPHD